MQIVKLDVVTNLGYLAYVEPIAPLVVIFYLKPSLQTL